MAAKFDGGAYLSSFIDAVLENLSSLLEEDDSYLERNNLLERLQNCLYEVGPVLDDAELKQFTDKKVKKWLVDLQDALYSSDDYLDELSTKAAINATQEDNPGNSSSWSRVVDSYIEDTGELDRIVARLESVIARKTYLRLKEGAKVDMSWRIPSTHLVVSSDIFGRDEDKEEVIKLLFDDTSHSESPLTIIPISGMGGIGKTTLAQLVYSDAKVVEKFNTRAWVCVAENFDPVTLTRIILQKISPASSLYTDDFDSLQTRLKEALTGKTFLVVLDDVWDDRQDTWEHVLKPFQYGNHESKILLTTRSEKVASMIAKAELHYQLGLLSDEDCWSVFLKQTHLSTDSINPTLEKICKDIVKKCDGLPLAAQGLGGLLRGNSDVKSWNLILKSEIWEFSDDTIKVVPALRISYYYLPSCLKRCFVYCSLFPKDYEFDKDELILLWMAENLLQPVGKKTPEEVGDEYFDELVARSFFQPHSTQEEIFVMHDLLHDLAMFFAREFCSMAEEPEKAVEIGIKTRHLSHIAKDYPISKLLEVCDRVKHTRTFLEINLETWIPINVENAACILLLSQLKYLRTLSFKSILLESLPDSIGELIHLRYLNLSETNIVTLPESLGRLYNLQTLKLYGCSRLKMLPVSMQDLVNLRHLDIRETGLNEMPIGMSKLKSLQFLSDYVVGKHEEKKMRELGALANLQQSICISHLENVVNSNEASEARMSDKDGLDFLKLCWSRNEDENIVDFQNEEDILHKLQPHSKELAPLVSVVSIEGNHLVESTVEALKQTQLSCLTCLSISDCSSHVLFPVSAIPPSLENFKIESCRKFEFQMDGQHHSLQVLSIVNSCDSVISFSFLDAFPSLINVEIRECEKVECIVVSGSLSFLRYFSIKDCGSLKSVSKVWMAAPQLQHLSLMGCPEMDMSPKGDPHCSLRSFQVRYSDKLVSSATLMNSQFPGLTHIHIWGEREIVSVKSFPKEGWLPASLESLTLCGIRILETLECKGLSHLNSLQTLCIQFCPKLENIEGEMLPASLLRLTISYSPLLGKRCEMKDPQVWPKVSHIQGIEVNGTLIL
ncbi:hypothetical protein PIB30_042311 [Stylosanthes scabra]|uniref:Disease resistance RPP13-like protein 1 n=1 Tax=Stylosanthes scabra TaxID=79078 RepID=A0ABU6YHJ7_9FABA|nr:hypothetical protein [Stylosanthes scabra]